MEETWKDIEGYEGLYQVSNLGRVKSLRSGKLLKQYINHQGYSQVTLSLNNVRCLRVEHFYIINFSTLKRKTSTCRWIYF